MEIKHLEQRLKQDTRINDLFDDFLVEEYNGQLKKVSAIRSRKELLQKIRGQKEEPTCPVKITLIAEKNENSIAMNSILQKLNDDILSLPYIEDIHNKQKDAPLSFKYDKDGEVMHEGIYSVIEHWIE